MKQDIHPQYFEKAKVSCACGANFVLGATKEEIQIEVCSQCHPFYSGKEKLIDVQGRVERFKRMVEKHEAIKKSKAKSQKSK